MIFSEEKDSIPSCRRLSSTKSAVFGLLPLRGGLFQTFVGIYDEHFSRQYGFWRPYIEQVIYRYLDCGDLHNGFAF
jgi:hypothetical protein